MFLNDYYRERARKVVEEMSKSGRFSWDDNLWEDMISEAIADVLMEECQKPALVKSIKEYAERMKAREESAKKDLKKDEKVLQLECDAGAGEPLRPPPTSAVLHGVRDERSPGTGIGTPEGCEAPDGTHAEDQGGEIDVCAG